MLRFISRRENGKRFSFRKSNGHTTRTGRAPQQVFFRAEALEPRTLLTTVTPDPGGTFNTAFNVGALAGEQTFMDSVAPGDFADIYKFTMPLAGHFNGRLRVYNGAAEIDLLQQFTDSSGTHIVLVDTRTAVPGSSDAAFASGDFDDSLGAGTYFIEIDNGSSGGTQYLTRFTADYAGSTLGTARDIGSAVNDTYADFVGGFGTPTLNDPSDIYKVKLDALARVTFTLTQDNGFTDPNTFRTHLEVITDLNHDGNIGNNDIEITTPSAPASIINYTLGAGIYYLRVVSDLNYANYHLNVYADYAGTTEQTARNLGNLDARVVANDFVSSAADFRDTYKFSLTEARPFFASLTAGSGIDLLLYRDIDNSGTIDNGELITSTVGQGSNQILRNLPKGNYFMRVDAFGNGAGKYSLTVEAPHDGAGNTLGTAKNLGTINGLFSGTGLDTYVSTTDTVDLYKITLPAAGTISATLAAFLGGNDELALIKDGNGNGNIDAGDVLVANNTAGSNHQVQKSVAAGTYFLRVRYTGPASPGISQYFLSFSTDYAGGTYSSARNVGALSGTKLFNETVGNGDTDDFYKFTLASTKAFKAILSGLANNADLYLAKDNNHNGNFDTSDIIASSKNGGTSIETISKTLSAGTYFVRVHQVTGNTAYSLSLKA